MSRRPTCPFCGAPDATFEDSEKAEDYIYETYSCECGGTFVEVFEYSHMEDEDGNAVEAAV